MNFDLHAPCHNCPFRHDVTFYLDPSRTEEIIEAITEGQQTFTCHNTIDYSRGDDEEHRIPSADEQHCAGALILLEKLERPSQMMRIAERLGMYDRRKLRMDAPVFDTPDEMIDRMNDLHAGRLK